MTADQAPAADPALDALDCLEHNAQHPGIKSEAEYNQRQMAHAATIRDALADRITPVMARQLLGTAIVQEITAWDELRSVLGRIADRDQEVTR